MKTKNVIIIRNVTVAYDKTPVLWDIDLCLPKGEMIAIIGPNGAGKSTLFQAILDFIKPITGEIQCFDLAIKEVRKKIAYIPQRSSIDWNFPTTVLEVAIMGRYRKFRWLPWERQVDIDAAQKILAMLGLDLFQNRQINQLSGGQKQRLFLARALLQEADLYLLDEPFAGVDATTEKMMMEIFTSLQNAGKTICIVHHDLHSVEKYFNYTVILNTRIVAAGPTSEVFNFENVQKAFGSRSTLLEEAFRLSHEQRS
jgi:manganese/zinc/iron transport system ATP- binding protein